MSDKLEGLELYVVRNKEGKFFRTKGYGGYGASWVDSPATARIYAKIGPARAAVKFWATSWPAFGVPDLVKLSVGKIEVLDETERICKVEEKAARREENKELNQAKQRMRNAQKELEKAKAKLALAKVERVGG